MYKPLRLKPFKDKYEVSISSVVPYTLIDTWKPTNKNHFKKQIVDIYEILHSTNELDVKCKNPESAKKVVFLREEKNK